MASLLPSTGSRQEVPSISHSNTYTNMEIDVDEASTADDCGGIAHAGDFGSDPEAQFSAFLLEDTLEA